MTKAKPAFIGTFKWSLVAALILALLIGAASGSLSKSLALLTQGNPSHLIGYLGLAVPALGLVLSIIAWPVRLLIWRMTAGT